MAMFLYLNNSSKFAFSKEETNFDSQNNLNYGLIGVPFDSTTTYKSGTRFGPKSIRESSYNLEHYNLNFDTNFTSNLFDLGDLDIIHGNLRKTLNYLQDTIFEVLKNNLIPITMGGEHSISLGVMEAFKKYNNLNDLTIIHFDAHMDLIDEYMGEKYSHATVMRRIFDLDPKRIIQLGVRSASYEEKIFIDSQDSIEYFSVDYLKNNFNNIISLLDDISGPIYISIDMDVLDPAYAPSVGNPVSGGITFLELSKLMEILSKKDNIIGLDLVEVSSFEFGDITSIAASRIIYDFLCLNDK